MSTAKQDPETKSIIEDDRTGMGQEVVRRAFLDNLVSLQGKSQHTATVRDRFFALAYTVRDRLFHRWIATHRKYYEVDARRVYYLSAEYLMGRSLASNLDALGLTEKARGALADLGLSLEEVLGEEEDAGLGNGGLGRLAACFLDSMATLQLPAMGYGLRYEFGIFDQVIRDGQQVERPDEWLKYGYPWEIERPEYTYEVKFGGHTERVPDGDGYRVRWIPGRAVLGVPYDTPVAGHGNDTVNTLRLWCARASREFDLAVFNEGDYIRAVADKNDSETISKVLYPADHSPQGKELRLRQQHFFVSCSVQDIVRRFAMTHRGFELFSDKVRLQLNDTHPAIAIPELMRILVDEHRVPWDEAWRHTSESCAYTNHTLLSEALEKWPVSLFESLLPRHLEIIFEINRRFLKEVAAKWPGDEARARRMSIIDEDGGRSVRMAHLALVGSRAVNGVAALHSRLLREHLFRDFFELWPDRFQNKTNGVTPRRWLNQANPKLSALVTEAIGPGWVRDLDELKRLEPFADDASFRERFAAVKQANKLALAELVRKEHGLSIDPASIFDVQVKRIHEYKRQILNILHAIALYARIKDGHRPQVPRTVLFGGKAAPAYRLAKLHIRLANSVAEVVNKDPAVRDHLRVLFLANYGVSMAQIIIPGANLSEQISTAGFEASGTGNMKFALNGALTIGTLDGANVEIREEVGADNFFLFGLTAEEVVEAKARGYRPREVMARTPELAHAIQLIERGVFGDPIALRPVLDALLHEDRYLVCADFDAYQKAQEIVAQAFLDRDRWTRMAILNVARSGKFSSDRTIRDYARDIWGVASIPVELKPYAQ
jgi:glycogen phosphorylase